MVDFDTIGKWGNGFALNRFERDGILLPKMSYGPWIDIVADYSGGVYCAASQNGARALLANGYCNWSNCNGEAAGGVWCNNNQSQCEDGCGGQWCTDDENTAPVQTDGFCNWGPNGDAESSTCDGGAMGGEWCNANQSQCEDGCGGRWCNNGNNFDPTFSPVPAPVAGPTAPSPPGSYINVCSSEDYEQVAYDKCCSTESGMCEFADGSTSNNENSLSPTKTPDEETFAPTYSPTVSPSTKPSSSPTNSINEETFAPTYSPTASETFAPTVEPTVDTSLTAMRIFKQAPIIRLKNGGTEYVGKLKVWLRDDTNKKMSSGVTVTVTATKENGQSKSVSKNTNGNGVAVLNLWRVNIDEEIKVKVDSITADGYVYDSNLNVEKDGCPVFSADCEEMTISAQ